MVSLNFLVPTVAILAMACVALSAPVAEALLAPIEDEISLEAGGILDGLFSEISGSSSSLGDMSSIVILLQASLTTISSSAIALVTSSCTPADKVISLNGIVTQLVNVVQKLVSFISVLGKPSVIGQLLGSTLLSPLLSAIATILSKISDIVGTVPSGTEGISDLTTAVGTLGTTLNSLVSSLGTSFPSLTTSASQLTTLTSTITKLLNSK